MISMSTPFSASTIRVRWLCGSSGAENRVMIERRDKGVSPPAPPIRGGTDRSVHVLPIFPLEQPGEARQDQQEEYHPDAHGASLYLCRLAGVVQEVDRVAHEGVE